MQIMSLDKNSIFLQSSASFSPPTNHSRSICLYVCALYMYVYIYMYCMYIENGPRNVANLGLNWTTWLNIRAYIQHLSCIVIKIFFFFWFGFILSSVLCLTTRLSLRILEKLSFQTRLGLFIRKRSEWCLAVNTIPDDHFRLL